MENQSKLNANFRKDKIPMWINGISILVLFILLFQAISAFVNPSWAYGAFDNSANANRQVLFTLAGRNIVMFVITLAALVSHNQ
jgi:hypothetical protein